MISAMDEEKELRDLAELNVPKGPRMPSMLKVLNSMKPKVIPNTNSKIKIKYPFRSSFRPLRMLVPEME